ncbi:hypothetical protein [Bosea lathyri]|uniref:Cellulose biosynthesis protein BcsS n=1 Tax=Bosea lathyri TaxID=1036778 RepID=A0A1H6BZB9_9HYPH|nr:hypothetical protein [Bosea lathyri]SEG66051.1 hypothetical protein SAMN04488115_108233 [Bosea lathyri]
MTAACVGVAALLTMAPPAKAADPAPARNTEVVAPVVQRDWTITISPYLWAASLNGDASVFGIRTHVDVPFRDTLENLDLGVMGNVEISRGAFGAYVNGEYVDVSNDARIGPFNIGVGMKSYLVSAGAFYRVYQSELGGNTVFGAPRVFALEPTVGARWTRLTGSLRLGGLHASDSESWLDPFVGARIHLDLTDRWNLFMEGDVGGFGAGSRLSLNGQALLGYRTTLLGYKSIIRAGYRVLHQDYREGGFQWKVTQHGPIVGASIEF